MNIEKLLEIAQGLSSQYSAIVDIQNDLADRVSYVQFYLEELVEFINEQIEA